MPVPVLIHRMIRNHSRRCCSMAGPSCCDTGSPPGIGSAPPDEPWYRASATNETPASSAIYHCRSIRNWHGCENQQALAPTGRPGSQGSTTICNSSIHVPGVWIEQIQLELRKQTLGTGVDGAHQSRAIVQSLPTRSGLESHPIRRKARVGYVWWPICAPARMNRSKLIARAVVTSRQGI